MSYDVEQNRLNTIGSLSGGRMGVLARAETSESRKSSAALTGGVQTPGRRESIPLGIIN